MKRVLKWLAAAFVGLSLTMVDLVDPSPAGAGSSARASTAEVAE